MRETLATGGKACRPLIARDGLGPAFIEPALKHLRERERARCGSSMNCARCALPTAGSPRSISATTPSLGADDAVILAVPTHAAAALVPGLERAAGLSRHRQRAFPHRRRRPDMPPMLGVINGTTEWVFAFAGPAVGHHQRRRPADGHAARELAQTIWNEVSRATGIAGRMPPWQIVRERRATFAATPEENAKRPGAADAVEQSVLAGDWTATGLPATIEERDAVRQSRGRGRHDAGARRMTIGPAADLDQQHRGGDAGAARPPAA